MVQFLEDHVLVFQRVGISDESLVDNLDDPVGVGRVHHFGLINCAVSAFSDGLDGETSTLG